MRSRVEIITLVFVLFLALTFTIKVTAEGAENPLKMGKITIPDCETIHFPCALTNYRPEPAGSIGPIDLEAIQNRLNSDLTRRYDVPYTKIGIFFDFMRLKIEASQSQSGFDFLSGCNPNGFYQKIQKTPFQFWEIKNIGFGILAEQKNNNTSFYVPAQDESTQWTDVIPGKNVSIRISLEYDF